MKIGLSSVNIFIYDLTNRKKLLFILTLLCASSKEKALEGNLLKSNI